MMPTTDITSSLRTSFRHGPLLWLTAFAYDALIFHMSHPTNSQDQYNCMPDVSEDPSPYMADYARNARQLRNARKQVQRTAWVHLEAKRKRIAERQTVHLTCDTSQG